MPLAGFFNSILPFKSSFSSQSNILNHKPDHGTPFLETLNGFLLLLRENWDSSPQVYKVLPFPVPPYMIYLLSPTVPRCSLCFSHTGLSLFLEHPKPLLPSGSSYLLFPLPRGFTSADSWLLLIFYVSAQMSPTQRNLPPPLYLKWPHNFHTVSPFYFLHGIYHELKNICLFTIYKYIFSFLRNISGMKASSMFFFSP